MSIRNYDRRSLLKAAGIGAASLALGGCVSGSGRHTNKKPVFITTNLHLDEIETRFESGVIDRLRERCVVLGLDGPSFRQSASLSADEIAMLGGSDVQNSSYRVAAS